MGPKIPSLLEFMENKINLRTKLGISQMNEILSKIDFSEESKKAHLGSLIFTEKANYFLSISAGQIIVDRQKYFAVSVSSPIGKLLLGKSENELISFNGVDQNILKIF